MVGHRSPGWGRDAAPVVAPRTILAGLVALLAAVLAVVPVGGLAVAAPRARAAGAPSVDGGGHLLTGVVRAQGQPVANAWVRYLPVTARGGWAGQGDGMLTDAEGRYLFRGVASDRVKVHVRAPASGGMVSTYWPQAYTYGQAGVLTLAEVTRADVVLPPGGSVRGRVVDRRTGQPLPGAVVTAHAGAGADTEMVGVPGLGSPVAGAFAIADLPPVPITLRVAAPPGGNHLGQWYDGAAYPAVASVIDGAARTEGLLFRLAEGGSIAGTIRDDAGEPVAGASVTLVGCPGQCPMFTTTGPDGRYVLRAVPTGTGFLLRASAEEADLLERWYQGPAGSLEGRIDVLAGQPLDDVDMVLTRGAWLAVRVTDAQTGGPIDGMSAELQSLTRPLLGYLPGVRDRLIVWAGGAAGPAPGAASGATCPPGSASSGDGIFVIGPVPPDDYRLTLFPGPRNEGYLPATWGATRGIDADGVVRLAAGERRQVEVGLVRTGPDPIRDEDCEQPGPASPSSGAAAAGAVTAEAAGSGPPGAVTGGDATDAAAAWPAPLAPPGTWPGLASGLDRAFTAAVPPAGPAGPRRSG
ncbi:MAG TPA: carboxypeptidase regulatory-like domain-containing protein [Candidatus Nanopelagicales bacterium]